jgi:hypothetical protein
VNAYSLRLKKIYYFTSTASLGLIAWAIQYCGETNLPPLIPAVRYFIIALYANWFLGYALFVTDRAIGSERLSGWAWLGLIGVFLSLMPPVFSGDLMEYLIRGRMLAIYHVSPYLATPQDFPNDILRPYSIWITNPDSYGPLSVYLQTLPAALFPTSILGMIWSYKIMVLAFYFVAVLFFWKLVHYLKLPNAAQLWAIFAYCPLIVVTALIDGHNDVIMMAFSVMSLYFLMRHRFSWAFFFWTCAFLLKYMVILQLPFMMLYAVRKKWDEQASFPWLFVFKQMIVNTVLVWLCFAPLWGGMNTFLAILRQKGAFYTNTIPFLFYFAVHSLALPADQQVFKTLFLAAFAFFYVYLLYRAWILSGSDYRSFFSIVAMSYLAFYAALPSPMGYWYLSWALFCIVLALWPKNLTLVLLYSAVGVLSFYKRINFLAALAAILYVFSLLCSLSQRKLVRE